MVDHPAVGDGEHEAAELRLVPTERMQPGEDAEKDVAGGR